MVYRISRVGRKKTAQAYRIYTGATTITGFFLFEAVIYIACCIILGSLWLPLTMQLYRARIMLVSSTNQYITAAYGLDRMSQDIQRTHISAHAWKKRELGYAIGTGKQGDFGWYLAYGRLMRVSGIYAHNAWRLPIVSTVMWPCQSLTYTYFVDHDSVVGISYKLLVRDTRTLSGFAAPRIGWIV